MSNHSKKVSSRSLENLSRDGRPPLHDEKKTAHNVTVTPKAWKGVREKANLLGYDSISELVEQIGRGNIHLTAANSSENCSALIEFVDYFREQFPEELKSFVEQKFSDFVEQKSSSLITD